MSGARKVNRANLKLYALPPETLPVMPYMPLHRVGIPPVQPSTLTNTRETVNMQEDLPREAEEVHWSTHEGIMSEAAVESVPGNQPTPAPLQGNLRPLRPTLARRARAGDPAAQYHFVTMS